MCKNVYFNLTFLGYAVTAATFQKTWSEQEIMAYIKRLFVEKLGDIKLEILIPYSGTLVQLNLARGTVLDVQLCVVYFLKKIFTLDPCQQLTTILKTVKTRSPVTVSMRKVTLTVFVMTIIFIYPG